MIAVKSKNPKVRKVEFYLQQAGQHIELMAKEEGGQTWYVLTLREDQPILLHSGIVGDINLELNADGYPLVRREI